jgi:hypothetical protein
LYHYVGPDDIRRWASGVPLGVRIAAAPDLRNWLAATDHSPNGGLAAGWNSEAWRQ